MIEDVLLRLRVRATHGIRRFLYPLSVDVSLPENVNRNLLSLTMDGVPVPLQVSPSTGELTAIDFAVSLAPWEERELHLAASGVSCPVADPLRVTPAGGNSAALHSVQERFRVHIGPDALLHEVAYDGIAHLRGPLRVDVTPPDTSNALRYAEAGGGPLSATSYVSTGKTDVTTRLTACKSWANVLYQRKPSAEAQEVVFTLPFAATSPTLTCDFGAGGGIYGKLQAGAANEMVWHTEFMENDTVRWSVTTNERTDYAGTVDTLGLYHTQQWFHVIDSNKALAVAITQVPLCCRTMTVTLNVDGNVEIAFALGDTVNGPMEFGVCYHFLNDMPAIAAATNPQSILLPPLVEVLP